jgi:hypothetical protein
MRLVWDDFEPRADKEKGGFFLATVATRRPDGSEIRGDQANHDEQKK